MISVALPNLNADLGHELNHVESEWVTASLSVGALIGALGGGALCDRWGRKLVLLIGDLWFVVGAIVVCTSFSVPQMIVRVAPSMWRLQLTEVNRSAASSLALASVSRARWRQS